MSLSPTGTAATWPPASTRFPVLAGGVPPARCSNFWAVVLAMLTLSLLGGCANMLYAGSASHLENGALTASRGWVAVDGVPELRQQGEHDCGITALDMVMQYWGSSADQPGRPQKTAEERWAAAELRDVARHAGFNAFVVEGQVQDLAHELKSGRPVIVGTAKPTITGEHVAHYEVVIGLHGKTQRIATLDPAQGLRQNSYQGFLQEWLPTGSVLLVVIPTEPRPPPTQVQAANRAEPMATTATTAARGRDQPDRRSQLR